MIDASLAEFDRNKQIEEQQIRDQQQLWVRSAWSSGCNSQSLAQGLIEQSIITSKSIATRFWTSTSRQHNIANRFGLSNQMGLLASLVPGLQEQMFQL